MRICNVWSSIRSLIRDLTFYQIKDLAGLVGLPVYKIGHLQQAPGGASKGQLMDALDDLYKEFDEEDQNRIVTSTITELIRVAPSSQPQIEDILARFGWGISDGQIHPLSLQIDLETAELPQPAREGIQNCLRRYRDGDVCGAVTAICGVLDVLTEEIYQSNALSEHRTATYQERISQSVNLLEPKFRAPLQASSLGAEEINRLWHNFRQACNQAAYVLATFRREFSDVHGVTTAPPQLVQRAIDCAVFIVRAILSLVQ